MVPVVPSLPLEMKQKDEKSGRSHFFVNSCGCSLDSFYEPSRPMFSAHVESIESIDHRPCGLFTQWFQFFLCADKCAILKKNWNVGETGPSIVNTCILKGVSQKTHWTPASPKMYFVQLLQTLRASLRVSQPQTYDRKKFGSEKKRQLWTGEKAEGGKSQRREEKKQEDQIERESEERREPRTTVFFHWKWGSPKRWVQSHLGRWEVKKNARRCGAHISKSNVLKADGLGPLLEVDMSKKCTPLWREAHFEVKMYKALQPQCTFGSSDVEKVYAVVAWSTLRVKSVTNWRSRATFGRSDDVLCGGCKGFCTLPKVSKTRGFYSSFKNVGRPGKFAKAPQRCMSRGRRSTRDMFIRDVWGSGHVRALISWDGLHFGASDLQVCWDDFAWQVQHFVWPGPTFRYRHTILDRRAGNIANARGCQLCLHPPFLKEVSQNCFVFDVVNLEKWGNLAELFRFRCCQLPKNEEGPENWFDVQRWCPRQDTPLRYITIQKLCPIQKLRFRNLNDSETPVCPDSETPLFVDWETSIFAGSETLLSPDSETSVCPDSETPVGLLSVTIQKLLCPDSETPAFPDSETRVSRFRNSSMSRFRNSSVSRFRNFCVPIFRKSSVCRFRNSSVSRFRNFSEKSFTAQPLS